VRRVLAALALVALVVAAVVVPVPLLVLAPGGAVSVPTHLEIEDPPGEITGDLLFTTVSLRQPSAVGALVALLDADREVVRRQEVIPPGVEEDEYVRVQRQLFEESARVAVAVGARAAGVDVEVSGEGAEVAGVVEGGPADGVLREGDVVEAIDGEPVELSADLAAATSRARAGDVVELAVRREGSLRTVEVEVAHVGELDRPALGVAVRTVGLEIDLPLEVEVDGGRIGGPSAGLMIALSAYDLLGDDDLTDGRVVAGTGTVDLRGRVGSVGGIPQKVQGARDVGAEVFVVGEREADEAREAAGDDLTVVAATTLDDAVAALRTAG
jgi:Lon-like protease